ncbi:hypothetical protein AMJ86_10400, partial [bacterium SM23_57]
MTEKDTRLSLDAEIPSISSELHDEPIAKPVAMDIEGDDDIIPQITKGDTEAPQIERQPTPPEDIPDTRKKASEVQDEGQDIPSIIAREDADTSETFAGFQDQTGEALDEEVLWTLPYDVAEESVPDMHEEDE